MESYLLVLSIAAVILLSFLIGIPLIVYFFTNDEEKTVEMWKKRYTPFFFLFAAALNYILGYYLIWLFYLPALGAVFVAIYWFKRR